MKGIIFSLTLSVFLLGFQCQTNVANAPTNATLLVDPSKYLSTGTYLKTQRSYIPEFNLNTSACYTSLKDLLGFFSDYEQAILLNAAQANTDPNRCFNCQAYASQLANGFQSQIAALSTHIGTQEKIKRNPLSCLLNFAPSLILNNLTYQNITSQVLSYLYFQKVSTQCMASFIGNVSRILLDRRRILCGLINDIDSMAIRTNGNITGFKWTYEEAVSMTDAFISLVECNALEMYSYPQTVVDSLTTIALDPKCNPSLIINNTSIIPGTTVVPGNQTINVTVLNVTTNATTATRGPLPPGRLRYLKDNTRSLRNDNNSLITAAPAPNATVTIVNVNETTLTTNETTTTTTTPPGANETAPSATGTTVIPPLTNATAPPTNATTTTTTTTTESNATAAIPSNATGPTVIPVANATTPLPPSNTTAASIIPNTNFTAAVPSNATGNATNQTVVVTPIVVPTTTPATMTTNETKSNISDLNMTTQSLANPATLGNPINNYLTTFTYGNFSTNQILITNLLSFNDLDQDLFIAIAQILLASRNNTGSLYHDFANKVNNTLFGQAYQYHCMPQLWYIFLSTIKNDLSLSPQFSSSEQCPADNVIILTNGTVRCEGNCTEVTNNSSIEFLSTVNHPQYYYIASSCIANKKVLFAHVIDQSGIPFVAFQRDIFDMNSRCISRDLQCAGNGGNAPACPRNHMSSVCSAQINARCSGLGLYNMVDKMPLSQTNSIFPPECNINDPSVSRRTQAFYIQCFTWIANTFTFGGMNMNYEQLSNLDQSWGNNKGPTNATAVQPTLRARLRMMRNENTTILPNATTTTVITISNVTTTTVITPNAPLVNLSNLIVISDPTRIDNATIPVTRIPFNQTIIAVDGVTPNEIIPKTVLFDNLAEVSAFNETVIPVGPTTNIIIPPNSSCTLKISSSLILILMFLLI